MAKYKVVEVTQFDAGLTLDGGFESERFESVLSEFCPAGWEIVSTKLLADNGAQRALVLLTR